MGKEAIYQYLKQGGLSHNGACAMMGNMWCESLLKSDNVEDRCSMSDADYTKAVNTGTISCYQFARDAFGYGLCQWTYWSRKDELWKRTVQKGLSISDEMAQCEFCIAELKRDYKFLYEFLCEGCDLYSATSRVCKEYERPAVNNIGDSVTGLLPNGEKGRYYYAMEFDKEFPDGTPKPTPTPSTDSVEVTVRVLRKGDLGRDVFLLQTGLQDMGIDCGIPDGDFGAHTELAVNELKEAVGLPMDGISDGDVWQMIFQ